MNLPLQITFRDVTPSPAVEAAIRDKAAKLEHFGPRITSCRVSVEAPHRSQHKGNAFRVRIDITVPGGEEIVVAKEPDATHDDVYVTVRDAFDAAQRQLQDLAEKRQDEKRRPS